jgi:hypothetical protein
LSLGPARSIAVDKRATLELGQFQDKIGKFDRSGSTRSRDLSEADNDKR